MEIKGEVFWIKECLKEYSPWGETHIVNICNGQETIIPWGVDAYILGGFLVVGALLFMLLFGSLIKMMLD